MISDTTYFGLLERHGSDKIIEVIVLKDDEDEVKYYNVKDQTWRYRSKDSFYDVLDSGMMLSVIALLKKEDAEKILDF